MSALVRVSREDGLLRVALNRPDSRNALSVALLAELGEALESGARDPDVRIVLLSGKGRDFCAGADIGEMRSLGSASPEQNREDARRLGAVFDAIHAFPRPVVARVHGNVFGGGNGLVAAADIALCADSSRFAFSEVRLGIVPAVISPHVVRRIGDTWARRLFLTGERFGAARAVGIGLCSAALDDADLDDAVEALVADLMHGSPDAQRRIKALLEEVGAGGGADARRRAAEVIAAARASEDGQEGLRAFLERRPPRWAPPEESS